MQEPKHDTIYRFVRENDQPFVTTNDVSEQFDSVTRRTIRQRLNELVERGKLQRRKVGANSVVWYTAD